LLGDYAKKIAVQTLMTDAHGSRHPTEIANLRGLRLAVSSEIGEGEHWDEARVKELTGDTELSARLMRQDFFEFKRGHKHLVYGNHRPMLRIVDPALAARLHIVPFEAVFDDELGNLDPLMPKKLRAEAPAIMSWLIEGHTKWRADGTLRRCARVENSTRDYLESQSTLDQWIEARCCIVADDGRAGRDWQKASALYADFAEWKRDRGEHPLSQTRWGEWIEKRFRRVKADGIRYVGVYLRARFG
jgi:putative DNA primase/helicase